MLGITSEQTHINASKLTCREYLTLMQKQELGRLHAIDATVLTMVPLTASDKVAEHVALRSNSRESSNVFLNTWSCQAFLLR